MSGTVATHEQTRFVYTENLSQKNRHDGLYETRLEHKVVSIVANPKARERCPVYVLDLYLSKLPKAAVDKNIFYCKHLPETPVDDKSPSIPIGKKPYP